MLKIAIIGAGNMAKLFAIRAKELNIYTYCFAWKNNAIAKDFVDSFIDINIFEKESILALCKEFHINGVLPTTELTIPIASYIANNMNLNTNSLEVSKNITNKLWVREIGKSFEFLKQPKFYSKKNIDDIINIKKFPVIVKPASYGGKHGITVVNNASEINEAITYAFKTIENRNTDGLIIEEFLADGNEYSVESLSFHKKHFIIQITQKDSSGAPHCVELGHHQPAELDNRLWKKVETAIIDMLNCLNIENGPCHTEIKIINDNIYLIEINARPGGDFITYPLTELSSGYKYLTGIILTACDIFYDPTFYLSEKKYSGVYFITKQTKYLIPLFNSCDKKEWLYRKNTVSKELQEITHNDSNNINSIIYCYSRKITKEDI